MPTATILHNTTNQSHIDSSSAAPRSPLRRKLGPSSTTKHVHSPDGYFAHEEAIVRAWRPLAVPDPANFRNRSKTHIGHGQGYPDSTLQDVAEEEDAANPHMWRKPSKTDSRSPCPALNVLSNHAHLPRDGRNIGIWTLVRALQEGYGASLVLAFALTFVSFVIIRLGGVGKGWLRPTFDLEDLAVHGVLEHNGSLTHPDANEDAPTFEPSHSRSSSASSTVISTANASTRPGPVASLHSRLLLALLQRLPFFSVLSRLPPLALLLPAPSHTHGQIQSSPALIHALLAESASGTHLTLADIARARVRREANTLPNSRILSQFADGEFAMSLDFLGNGDGRVEIGVLREWLEEERLPKNWKPNHVQGLWRTHVATEKVRSLMRGLRKYNQKTKESAVRSVVYE